MAHLQDLGPEVRREGLGEDHAVHGLWAHTAGCPTQAVPSLPACWVGPGMG